MTPRAPAPAGLTTIWRVVLALFVGWAAFAYRFQAPYFHNDHFEHLSMARQMLFGEFPTRDFIDPGRPLTVGLSAIGQWIAPNLLSEALLTMGGLAIGAALTFWLAAGATRSVLLGLAASGIVVAILPRLYSYPKILVFPVVLLAMWRYIDVPTMRRLAVLAAAVVFAFLMRHDFGLYSGIATGAIVFVTPRIPSVQRTATFVALGLLIASPWFVWLASIGHLEGSSGGDVAQATEMLTGGGYLSRPPLQLDLSHGLVHVDPVIARVQIRWSPGADAAARRAAESKYGLVQRTDDGDRNSTYGLTDGSTSNLRALLNDPLVEDTGGFDRQRSRLEGSWFDRALNRTGISRIVWGPFFDPAGASVWLYYFIWAIPVLALVRLALKSGASSDYPGEWRKIASAALLGILLNLYLIRGSFDSRLPDVIVPAAVVGAWLLSELIRYTGRARVLVGGVGVAVSILFWAALTTYESTASLPRLATAAFRIAPLRKAASELAQRPIDFYAPAGATGVKRLTRYVHECLRPDDRLLLVAYEPEVFYYSERLFAGGMEYFHARRFSTAPELSLTLERLARQQVPLVIVEQARAGMFEESYRPIADWVRAGYRHAATETFVDNRTWNVYADRSRPVTMTRDGGLPCYQ